MIWSFFIDVFRKMMLNNEMAICHVESTQFGIQVTAVTIYTRTNNPATHLMISSSLSSSKLLMAAAFD